MSYTLNMKKAERELKKKHKRQFIEYWEEKEREIKRKENIFFAMLKEEKETAIRQEKELAERIIKINTFLHNKAKQLPFKLWLTLRDLLTNDYVQIESDLNKGKISNEDLTLIKGIAREIDIQ